MQVRDRVTQETKSDILFLELEPHPSSPVAEGSEPSTPVGEEDLLLSPELELNFSDFIGAAALNPV